MWEISPPAPIHNTPVFENTVWSKPAILLWRSSAPGTGLPRSLIEVCETVNAGLMFFDSFSVDFDFKVLIQPDEAYKSVAAENRHHGYVPSAFQSLLEIL